MAEPPEAGDDLVGAEQDVVARADLPHALEVALRREERAARVLHGLEDDHRDRLGPCLQDGLLEVLEQERGELLLRLLRRTVVAVRVTHVDDVRYERLERRAQRGDPVDGESPHRRPVVGDPARDRLPAAVGGELLLDPLAGLHAEHLRPLPVAARRVVLACELPGGLDGLGAAVHEEDAVQVTRGERRDLGGELDGARVRVAPVRVEGQLAHLRGGRFPHLLPVPIADLDGEETGESVEVALPLGVLEVAPVAAHDDREIVLLVAAHACEVQPQMLARGALQLLRGKAGFAGDGPLSQFSPSRA